SLKNIEVSINSAPAISLVESLTGNQFSYYLSPSQLNNGDNSLVVTITNSQGLSDKVKTVFTYEKPSLATLLLTPAHDTYASGDVRVTGMVYSATTLNSVVLNTSNQTSKNILANIKEEHFSVVMKPSELLGATLPSPEGKTVRLTLAATSSVAENKTTHSFTYFPISTHVPGGDLVVINDLDPFYSKINSANNIQFALNLVNFKTPGKPRSNAKQIVFDAEYGTAGDNYHALGKLYQANDWKLTVFETESGSAAVTTAFYKAIPEDVKVIFLWEPRSIFTEAKVAALKQFAAEGGRLVFMGEGPAHYSAIDKVENNLFKQLGLQLKANSDNAGFSGTLAVSGVPHQLLVGVKTLEMNVPASLSLGPNDVPLVADEKGNVYIAVARIDVTNKP
ncbi:MAG: hypothetical protein RL497_1063, partial [Pseudomonadota bacterium]